MQDPEKLKQLMRFWEDVTQTQLVNFHLDLTASAEIKGTKRDLIVEFPNYDKVGDDEEAVTPATTRLVSTTKPMGNYDYDIRSFVPIRPADDNEPMSFWIGRVVDVHPGRIIM